MGSRETSLCLARLTLGWNRGGRETKAYWGLVGGEAKTIHSRARGGRHGQWVSFPGDGGQGSGCREGKKVHVGDGATKKSYPRVLGLPWDSVLAPPQRALSPL